MLLVQPFTVKQGHGLTKQFSSPTQINHTLKNQKNKAQLKYTIHLLTDPMRYNIKSDCELLFIAQCQVKNNSSGRRSKGPQCVLVLATG